MSLTLFCKVLYYSGRDARRHAYPGFGLFALRKLVLAFSREPRPAMRSAMARRLPTVHQRAPARCSVHSTVSVGRMGARPRARAESFVTPGPFHQPMAS